MIYSLEDYQVIYVQKLKHERDVLLAAVLFIENNPPDSPAEYAEIRDVARRALHECD